MSNLILRRGKAEDARLLAELGSRTFSETFADDNTPENMAAYLDSAFNPSQQAAELAEPHSLFLIAETAGPSAETRGLFAESKEAEAKAEAVAVGYAMLRAGNKPDAVTDDKAIELVRLYVSRESIGSGVGAALMQACIDEARQRGYKTLWLGVWEHNTRAQAFYRKWNFQAVGSHVFQLGDDPQTDILMQCRIYGNK